MTREEWLQLNHTKELFEELDSRIGDLQDMQPPLDSHASGVHVGLLEAQNLLTFGVQQ